MVEQLLQFGVSLSAILILSAIAWFAYPHRFTITADAVNEAIGRTLTQSALQDLLIDSKESAALARTEDLSLYAARQMGRDVTIRSLDGVAGQIDATSLTLEFDDITMPPLVLDYSAEDAKIAAQWLKEAGVALEVKG